jgi:hypothetical protein
MRKLSRDPVTSEYSPQAFFQPRYAFEAMLMRATMSLGEKPIESSRGDSGEGRLEKTVTYYRTRLCS